MSLPRNSELLTNARQLRKEMTKEESLLWFRFLRTCPVKFYRQRIVGNYILDFYCASMKLAIELDGSQHYEPEEKERDDRRTQYLNELGIEVLRFSNADVMQRFESVCEAIYEKIKGAPVKRRRSE